VVHLVFAVQEVDHILEEERFQIQVAFPAVVLVQSRVASERSVGDNLVEEEERIQEDGNLAVRHNLRGKVGDVEEVLVVEVGELYFWERLEEERNCSFLDEDRIQEERWIWKGIRA